MFFSVNIEYKIYIICIYLYIFVRDGGEQMMKNQKGITLIALVITIVILIILATISVNAVFGENGIMQQAEAAKEVQAKAEEEEEKVLNDYPDDIDKMVAGGNYTDKYSDNTLPVAPRLASGMTKVKWNSSTSKWEKVTDDTEAWYNYANKEWANVVLVGEDGKDATGTVDVFNEDGTLNEDSAYTQLVWIPRYAYQITSQYHTGGSTAGNINIVFVDTNNQNKDKSKTYSTEYPEATAGATTGMSDYVVHPAFDYGGEHLSGFWIGKYESSNASCTTDVATGQVNYTGNEIMTVKANVTSWRQISIGNAFITCLNMNRSGNPYGLSTSDSVVDPHLTKNNEWGAVAYLSQSIYGKNAEVWNNSNTSYITGMSGSSVDANDEETMNAYNTALGVEASTTGNETGIYDMSGGNWERVAAYVNNGHANLTSQGGQLTVAGTQSKYRNVYASTVSDGSNAQASDYLLATPENGHYGDAVYETSNVASGQDSWYNDYSNFPNLEWPFFGRGGRRNDTTGAGVFYFGNAGGDPLGGDGFRVVVPVL